MRARVIERGTGAAVGEIEADTSYGLWLALLAWGERQGVARFQVPSRFRTERAADGAPAATPAADTPTAELTPLTPLIRGERAGGVSTDSPLTREGRGVDPALSLAPPPAPGGAAVQLPLTDDLAAPVVTPARSAGDGARPTRRHRAAGAAEQLRLFDQP